MEDKGKSNNHTPEDAVFSRTLRAGKRTYFFDVKKLYSNDEHFIAVTESKKKFNNSNGKFYYEKHKIFLYKEDFDKFIEALQETVGHVKTELMPEVDFSQFAERVESNGESDDELNWD